MPRTASIDHLDSLPPARLVIIDGPGTGQRYELGDEVRIGRSLKCDLVLDDVEVSREHARIWIEDGRHLIRDLGSRNGTRVNGRRVEEEPLEFGDKIRLGPHVVLQLTTFDPVEDHILQRQRLETLGRLTAGIAHDLNNMLGAVTASATFMRQLDASDRSGVEGEECLDDIESAARRAADLAARLLTFARARPTREATNVSELALDAVRLARRTFDRSIVIGAEVAPNLHVDGDPAQLHQVLMNLLVNARDAVATGGGKRITVRVARTGAAKVGLHVEDDGCGMDETTQQRIFEPFYTTKRVGVGFGVGLATVRDVIEAHGGSITVQSVVDRGTEFSVQLREARPATTRHRRPTRVFDAPAERRDTPRRVLLVDDEVVMQRSLGRVLRRAGFDVEVCADGEEALARIGSDVDVLVLDLDLPRMSGHAVLAELRARGLDLPVVAISGHRDALEQDDRLRSAAAFLAKPFEPDRLIQAVQDAVTVEETSEKTIDATRE